MIHKSFSASSCSSTWSSQPCHPAAARALAVAVPRRGRQPRVAVAADAQTEEERAREVRQQVTRRIKALGAERKIREAIQELAGLSRLGLQPDVQAATALVSAAVQAGNVEVAQSIFDELFGDFLEPDEVAYAVLLRGYGGSGREPAWGQIDAVLTRMRQQSGIMPTATSFNALLEACVRSNDASRGLDVLDRMAADGVEPDELTLGIVARKRVLRSHLRKLFA